MSRSSSASINQTIPLPQLGVLAVNGADAANFLQGYLTSDTQKINPHVLQSTALCNLQGRVIANGYAIAVHQGIWLILDRTAVPLVAEFLKKYLLFAKSQAQDLTQSITLYACTPNTRRAIQYAEDAALTWGEATAPVVPEPEAHNAWLYREIDAHRLFLPACLAGQFLPQMLDLELTGALSFEKGCYLGQEIVARAQHRGELKRKLMTLNWQGNLPSAGDKLLTEEGQIAGSLISAASARDKTEGLALAVVATRFFGPALSQTRPATENATKFRNSNVQNPTWFRQAF